MLIFFVAFYLSFNVCFSYRVYDYRLDDYRPWEVCKRTDCSGKKACVTLYQKSNFEGWYQCYTISHDGCIFLESWWTNEGPRVSSINSHATCVRLYTTTECTGPSVEIKPGSSYHNDLDKLGFDDQTRSIGSCTRPVQRLPPQTYEKCDKNDCSGTTACASIYQHRNFEGCVQCYPIRNNECRYLTDWFRDRTSSVNTHGTCVRLYYDLDCRGVYVEVRPGSKSHNDLSMLNFEDETNSISSCERPTKGQACYVRTLFSKFIPSEKVSKASADIDKVIDGIASIYFSAAAVVIPGADLFNNIIKFIDGFMKSEVAIEVLIDAKIDEAFARNSASQLGAKIHAINRLVKTMLSPFTALEYRKSEAVAALAYCQEIHNLFENERYTFSQNKLVSSPYLVSFSTIYLVVANFMYKIRPEPLIRATLVSDINRLAELNKVYMREAMVQRKGKLSCQIYWLFQLYFVKDLITVYKRLPYHEHDYYVVGRKRCEMCIEITGRSIDTEITLFFTPIITQLTKFPQRENGFH